MSAESEKREHLYDILEDFDTAMLVTQSAAGLHARPMAVAELRAGADAYFITSADAPKVQELMGDSKMALTFQSASQFASVTGTGTVVRDQALIDRLWNESWKVWFPKGKSDPAVTLIKFDAQAGEYWNNAGAQGVKFMFKAIKAYATGDTPSADEKMHGKVKL